MKPGHELDLLIAEKVMGWRMGPAKFGSTQDMYQCWIANDKTPIMTIHMTPHYSTDIAAAWEVVEVMKKKTDMSRGFAVITGFQVRALSYNSYRAGFSCDTGGHEDSGFYHDYADGESAPHAICLAALKAVEVEV